MVAFLEAGAPAVEAARRAADGTRGRIRFGDVRLEAPIRRPPKFLAIGLNYADHVAESRMQKPEFPVFFNKQSTCVTGPRDPIHRPRVSTMLDYEGELGFVIGRRCRYVPKERAAEVIAGYLVVDDVSVRDWQFRAQTMTLGKSFDTHGPIGPWIVTPDEVGDPHVPRIEDVGERRAPAALEHAGADLRLLRSGRDAVDRVHARAGRRHCDRDAGRRRRRAGARFLVPGDVVRIEIEQIGAIENRVVEEPQDVDRI